MDRKTKNMKTAKPTSKRRTANPRALATPVESVADFKQRIALMMRNQEGDKKYSVVGASRPNVIVVGNNRVKVL
jgi:hypothetical protein